MVKVDLVLFKMAGKFPAIFNITKTDVTNVTNKGANVR